MDPFAHVKQIRRRELKDQIKFYAKKTKLAEQQLKKAQASYTKAKNKQSTYESFYQTIASQNFRAELVYVCNSPIEIFEKRFIALLRQFLREGLSIETIAEIIDQPVSFVQDRINENRRIVVNTKESSEN